MAIDRKSLIQLLLIPSAIAAITMALPLPANAANWYVSIQGDDGWSGTSAQPFRHIQKGADMAQPGDTVFIKGDPTPYTEQVTLPRSGTPSARISFKPWPGTGIVYLKNGITRHANIGAVFVFRENRSFISIEGFTFTDSEYGYYIQMYNPTYDPSTGSIQGNIISGNIFQNLGGYELEKGGGCIVAQGIGPHNSFNNNVFTNCYAGAINLGNSAYNEVRFNTISGMKEQERDWEEPTGVADTTCAYGILVGGDFGAYNAIGNNYVADFPGSAVNRIGLWTDCGAHHNTFERNMVHDVGYGFCMESRCHDDIVRENISYHNLVGFATAGFSVQATRDAQWINNVAYENSYVGFSFEQSSGNIVRNNISLNNGASQVYVADYTASHGGNVFSNNCWYKQGSPVIAVWSDPKHKLQTPANLILSQWVGASGDSNSINQNPLFVSPTSDYHLQTSPVSPCIQAGYEGVDMGAYPKIEPPVASFTGNLTSGTAPLTVNFVETSTGSPTSWSWSFGDGSTSTSQHPSHQYISIGNYTVSLTATNTCGSEVETKPNYISVTGGIPKTEVKGNGVVIVDKDSTPTTADLTDFGAVDNTNGIVDRTYTVDNPGAASLTLHPVVITGPQAADFSMVSQPADLVPPNGSTTFTVRFDPSATGLRSATLSIPNNNSNTNPYNFSIQGTGAGSVPEVDVKGNGLEIVAGDIIPSTSDHTDFGSANISGGTVTRTYTIYNTGTATLTLSGTPVVTVSGANAGDFTVTSQPMGLVVGGGSTTFQMRFDPSVIGTRAAIVSLGTNDTDEGSYDFSVQGMGSSGTVYLSDLTWVGTPTNGWGPVEKNMSIGDRVSGDGPTLSVGGTTYSKGLGCHADSEITYDLNGQYSTFLASVGVDDEVDIYSAGSVVFSVLADGVEIYNSGLKTWNQAASSINVEVAGKNQLKLIVTNGGDDFICDWADWGNARLTTIAPKAE